MTDIWTTPERVALRKLTRDFTEREIVPYLSQWEEDGEVPRSLHKKAAEAGLLGISAPVEYGGSGGDAIDNTIVQEEMLYAGASSGLLSALYTHGIALPHIMSSRDPYLIDRYVRPTLAGEMIGSLAVTEPDAGSDVSAIRTKAVLDGDHYVINGSKTFITSSTRADFITTMVRTGDDAHHGISIVVVDTNTPGFSVVRRLSKMGWLCSDTGELSYVDVRVPATNLVGKPGSGFVQAATQFGGERLGLAIHAYGIAQRALDLTVEHCKNRIVFGKPLIAKQVVRHKLVEMTRAVEVSRSYTHVIMERIHNGEQNLFAQAAMAKNQAVEACDFVVDAAVQLHGGMGYMRDCEVERHYRDSKILGIGGGATEVMNDLIAKSLFG